MVYLLIQSDHAPSDFVANLQRALTRDVADTVGSFRAEATVEADISGATPTHILRIATQFDVESGWLRRVSKLTPDGPDRRTAFLGEIDPSVVEAFGSLVFDRSPAKCREAFGELVHWLGGVSDTAEAPDISPQESLESAPDRLENRVFEQLEDNPTLLLLAQQGRAQRIFVNQLRLRAVERFGEGRVLAVSPPGSLDVSLEELFQHLGRQCGAGFEQVERQFDWERCLTEKIDREGEVCLLISRFEHASKQNQDAIAIVLRGLVEQLPLGSFFVVVSGGETLARQKVTVGELSFLNHADWMLFPELGPRDFDAWNRENKFAASFSAELTQAILDRYGGHPGISMRALGALRRHRPQDLGTALDLLDEEESLQSWFDHLFVPFETDDGTIDQLLSFLYSPRLMGQFSFWPASSLVRNLFWRNLITQDGTSFRWRSETIQNAGIDVISRGPAKKAETP